MRNSNGIPVGPSNYIIVPQLPFIESKGDVGVRQKSIPFQLAGFPELGVRVSKALKAKQPLDLIGGDDLIFDCIGREYSMIKFRIVVSIPRVFCVFIHLTSFLVSGQATSPSKSG